MLPLILDKGCLNKIQVYCSLQIHCAKTCNGTTELVSSPTSVFLLMRTPLTALRLRELGVRFEMLNVGGLGAGPGRHPLYKNISATDEEMAAMRTLEEMGTKVELRIVADDHGVPFASVDKR